MRKINRIIVHCSASSFGDASDIDMWHRQRGWSQIGYHYVILNGKRDKHIPYTIGDDGVIETGRPVDIQGAHSKGQNRDSIGICVIGTHFFTGKQLYESLPNLLASLLFTYDLTKDDVYGHHDFNLYKSCPNISTDLIRGGISMGMHND